MPIADLCNGGHVIGRQLFGIHFQNYMNYAVLQRPRGLLVLPSVIGEVEVRHFLTLLVDLGRIGPYRVSFEDSLSFHVNLDGLALSDRVLEGRIITVEEDLPSIMMVLHTLVLFLIALIEFPE